MVTDGSNNERLPSMDDDDGEWLEWWRIQKHTQWVNGIDERYGKLIVDQPTNYLEFVEDLFLFLWRNQRSEKGEYLGERHGKNYTRQTESRTLINPNELIIHTDVYTQNDFEIQNFYRMINLCDEQIMILCDHNKRPHSRLALRIEEKFEENKKVLTEKKIEIRKRNLAYCTNQSD